MNSKLKILLLADPFSSHAIKWANGLFKKDIDVTVFGLSNYSENQYASGIKIIASRFPDYIKYKDDGNFLKSFYLFALPNLKKIIKQSAPVILHAHSASSYGFLGALSGYNPYLISVWGNDVFNFPKKSSLHKNLIKYNLSKADKIFSTSFMMCEETKKYTNKEIEVIPFGIDLEVFKPNHQRKLFSENDIVIGTIKSLEPKYGIIDLVKAFKVVKEKLPELPLKLLLVGRGSLENKVKQLTNDLDIIDSTTITGFVPYNEVVKYHNELDIMVAVSTEDSESFGVSVIEASACEKPVIVSDKGGLKEVVQNDVTGIVVSANNHLQLAKELEKLILNKELGTSLGKAGRERVKKYYNWEENVSQMIINYQRIWEKYFASL